MEINALERLIQQCGSVEKAAHVLGTSHQNVSSMRNGRTWVKYTVAQKIAKYLWETVKYLVNPLDLISPRERNELKSLFFSFTHQPIKSMNVSMRDVKCDFPVPHLIDEDQRPLNQLRSIIIDEHNQLISNEETYFLYKKYHKKTIPVWKLSLLDLENGKYDLNDLTKAFDLMERTENPSSCYFIRLRSPKE